MRTWSAVCITSASATGRSAETQRAALPGAVRADGRPRQLDQRAGGAILDESLPVARRGGLRRGAQPARPRQRNRQSSASGVGLPFPCALRTATQRAARRCRRTCRRLSNASAKRRPSTNAFRRSGILALAQLRSGDVWSARATAKEGSRSDRPRPPADRPQHARRLFVARHGRARCLARGAVAAVAARDQTLSACSGALSKELSGGRTALSAPSGRLPAALRFDPARRAGAIGAARRRPSRLGMPWEAGAVGKRWTLRRCRSLICRAATSSV